MIFRVFLIRLLPSLAFGFPVAATAGTDAAPILPLLDKVAHRQLAQPGSFDIEWQSPSGAELEQIRLGWDGHLLRRRTRPAQPAPETMTPPGWRYLVHREAGNLAFTDLPPAVKQAWRKEIGLNPQHITRLKLMDEGASRGWEMATFYVGLNALANLSTDPVYDRALTQLAEAQHWQPGPRVYHADDLLVSFLHLRLYARERKPERIAAIQARADWLIAHPSPQSLDIREGQARWTWCDALFMAPPVWLQLWKATGDRRYLEHLDREWWATTEFLFSPRDGLFYRDAKFFDQRERNGEKIFWSRGNAWVLASLALMLEDLPADFPTRSRYQQLFQTLAERVAALQPTDALWRSSLLDPAGSPNPESSSTAFFCYAFARGIRLGLLDATQFQPIVDRTWLALTGCVQEDGRLGYVQQPGAAPGKSDKLSTAPYGVGALLLAGVEIELLRRERASGGR